MNPQSLTTPGSWKERRLLSARVAGEAWSRAPEKNSIKATESRDSAKPWASLVGMVILIIVCVAALYILWAKIAGAWPFP